MSDSNQPNIGRTIYGFCDGYFGRGSYDAKRIEAEGYDWIIARPLDPDAQPEFAAIRPEVKQELIDAWAVNHNRFEEMYT